MTLDAISSRSVNFNTHRDTDLLSADDLMVAIGVLNFRMNEMVIQNHMREFQDNVEQISELSRIKNKYTSQMNAMSDEQKAAGLYINDKGDLVSVMDSKNIEDIALPDPEKLAESPVESTWNTKFTTADDEVLDISISYQFGYDQQKGQYYFQITEFKIGDFMHKTSTLDYDVSSGFEFTNSEESVEQYEETQSARKPASTDHSSTGEYFAYDGTQMDPSMYENEHIASNENEPISIKSIGDLGDKVYIDGTESFTDVLNNLFSKILEKIELEYGDNTLSDGELYRMPIKNGLLENQNEIVNKLNYDIFQEMEKNGYDSDSFDAIFMENGGGSSAGALAPNGQMSLEFPVGEFTFKLDIYWEYDTATSGFNFSTYISIPGYSDPTKAYGNLSKPDSGSIYQGNNASLLNIVNIEGAMPTEGQTANEFLTEQLTKIINEVGKKLDEHSLKPIGSGSEYEESTAFWQALLGDLMDLKYKDRNKGLDTIQINEINKTIVDELMGGDIHIKNFEVFSDNLRDNFSDLIPNAVDSIIFNDNFDISLLNIPKSAVATDGTTAVIPGFYEPNLVVSNTPGGNVQAYLQKIMGEEIYTNGLAYSENYWSTEIIPQITDIITALGSANEITMSKIRRSIETANSYLQMIITNLQKQFQSLNAISNNM